jgi:cell division protein FtsW
MSFFGEKTAKISIPFYFAISLVLLATIPLFGQTIKGSRRWIYLFGFSIQPTEFIKPSFILLNAFALALLDSGKGGKKLICLNIIFIILIICLLYKQPDVGNCCLFLFAVFAQVFFLDSFTSGLLLKCLAGFAVLFFIMYLSFSHVYSRVNNFVVSFFSVEKATYQVRSSISGYRNSGFLGRGFLEGEVKKHIPDAHTDFVLPVISEEFGCVAVFLLLASYFFLFCRIMAKASLREDRAVFFMLVGLAPLFMIQIIINVCVSLNFLPTKGMTIPFMSYGGSSLIANAITFGYALIFTKDSMIRKKNIENTVIGWEISDEQTASQ